MVDRQDFARAVDLMHNNGFPRGQFHKYRGSFPEERNGVISDRGSHLLHVCAVPVSFRDDQPDRWCRYRAVHIVLGGEAAY